MAVNSIPGASGVSTAQLASASRTVSNELGKDAFLRLLIAQLSNQDPLNPMSDTEFIAQMAQFSALEQMTNMTKTLDGMAALEQYSAVSYVGRMVAFEYTDEAGYKTPVIDYVAAVWYDSKEGPILETSMYGDIPLKRIEGVSGYASA